MKRMNRSIVGEKAAQSSKQERRFPPFVSESVTFKPERGSDGDQSDYHHVC